MITKNLIMHIISQSEREGGLLVGEIKNHIHDNCPQAGSFSINTVRKKVYALLDEGYLVGNSSSKNGVRYALTEKPNDVNLFYIGVGLISHDKNSIECFNSIEGKLYEGSDSFDEFVAAIVNERNLWIRSEEEHILIHQRGKKDSVSVDYRGRKKIKENFFDKQSYLDVFGF